MRRIGILTFHASHNYGSMLQAYALQRHLQTQGCHVEIINFRSDAQRHGVYPYPLELRGMNLAKQLLTPVWLYHRCRQWKRFEVFMAENMCLSEKTYKTWEDMQGDMNKFDVIITGGDQIWNMNCYDFDKSYFLPGKLEKARKVSYCPSFGDFLNKIPKGQAAFVKEQLSEYDALSVREFSTGEYLKNLLGKDVEVVADPTLLLSADDYQEIMDDTPLVKGDYILYYTPRNCPELECIAALFGKQRGMKVITTRPRKFGNNGLIPFNGAGPKEFLNLLKNARLVAGASYHLVVFALIFHKEFIAFNGASDNRISNLLNYLGMSERGIITDKNYRNIRLAPINYVNTDMLLRKLRESSLSYLTKALL